MPVVYFSRTAVPFSLNQARDTRNPPETIEFLKLEGSRLDVDRARCRFQGNQQMHGPGWFLDARRCILSPLATSLFALRDWLKFRRRNLRLRLSFAQ